MIAKVHDTSKGVKWKMHGDLYGLSLGRYDSKIYGTGFTLKHFYFGEEIWKLK